MFYLEAAFSLTTMFSSVSCYMLEFFSNSFVCVSGAGGWCVPFSCFPSNVALNISPSLTH